MNGKTYTYNTNGVRPHAVTAVGATNYAYDDNGNMTNRGNQTLTWDEENRLVGVDGGASFAYDGDGNRIKKIQAGAQTTIYVNKYYEKTGTQVTTSYYFGSRLIAQRTYAEQTYTLRYVLQDHLGSTTGTVSSAGNLEATIKFFPFGATRSGSVPTDKKFTGQRLDATGLYYYNARYYDATIGRFISPDTIVQDPMNAQCFNRYSYCLNNPLRYIDPSGHESISDYLNILGLYGINVYSDVIIVGGSGQPISELEALVEEYKKSGILNYTDRVTILADNRKEWPVGFDVSTRLEQLYAELAVGHHNIMLLGFSEGAATVATFLWQLAYDPEGTASKMGSTPTSEIAAAVLFECPNNATSRWFGDWDINGLFPGLAGLPNALVRSGITISLADVWNTDSIVHGPPVTGWEGISFSYSSNPSLRHNIGGWIIGLLDTNSEHGDVLRNQYALSVMHDTFYQY